MTYYHILCWVAPGRRCHARPEARKGWKLLSDAQFMQRSAMYAVWVDYLRCIAADDAELGAAGLVRAQRAVEDAALFHILAVVAGRG
ncbi:MAG: hypothetical protein Q8P60_12415 [Pseudorhodobacter sp.]|nr:hypothetical protein [Pseudorhodobacter sp.]